MSQSPTRVLILGGGFAGLAAARCFERHLPRDGSIAVTLVSRDNYLLFTPMLAEVATGQINPIHIATPTRAFLRRVKVRQGEVVGVDLERRRVQTYSPEVQDQAELPYDHLILALGSTASFRHAPGAETHAFPFKHLGDAARIRDRVLDCIDWAAGESDPAKRRAFLTFVVAGGGFAGVELAAALADFLHATKRYYPRLAGEMPQLLLAHHGPRLLEELPEAAAAYTLKRLRRQDVDLRLRTGVTAVTQETVTLDPGGTVPTRSVFWTAGVAPNPLVASLTLPKDQHGAVVVDGHLAVPKQPGLWAIGDCAAIPNARTGGTYAPLAQNAEREGPVVAYNVLAAVRGKPPRTFNYDPQGSFASLGRRNAVGKVMGWQVSGYLAWLMWRTVYLAKLPGIDRRVRVGGDWLLDQLFPPDMVALHAGTRGPYNSPPLTDEALYQADLAAAQTHDAPVGPAH